MLYCFFFTVIFIEVYKKISLNQNLVVNPVYTCIGMVMPDKIGDPFNLLF